MRTIASALVAIGIIFHPTAALTATDPAIGCQTSKLKMAGKYGACRLNEEAKAVEAGGSPDFAKCAGTFSHRWQSAETKAGPGVCPSEGDEATVDARIIAHVDAIDALLAAGIPPDCGASQRFPASGQTTSYGAGDDGALQAGATLAYVDNADGTITDSNTGLMWEKKVQGTGSGTSCTSEGGTCANPHDADNTYTWSAGGTNYDGGVVTIFLNQLNNRCNNNTAVSCTTNADCSVPGGACGFAGHRDWRLPNIKELVGIVDFSKGYPGPTVAAAFNGASCGFACVDLTNPACSCDAASIYWSASTYASFPPYAWYVYTYSGYTFGYNKTDSYFVRAVRSGS